MYSCVWYKKVVWFHFSACIYLSLLQSHTDQSWTLGSFTYGVDSEWIPLFFGSWVCASIMGMIVSTFKVIITIEWEEYHSLLTTVSGKHFHIFRCNLLLCPLITVRMGVEINCDNCPLQVGSTCSEEWQWMNLQTHKSLHQPNEGKIIILPFVLHISLKV